MKRIVSVVAAFVFVASGCSSDGEAGDPTSSSSPTTIATTSATTAVATSAPPTTSTTTPTTLPPTTSTTTTSTTTTTAPDATDWASVVQTLGRHRQELYAAPDASRVSEVCTSDSPCAEQLNVQLADLASKGWSLVGTDPYNVLSAELEDFDGESLDTALVVTVVVVIQRPDQAGTIVDSSGATVAPVDPTTAEGVNTENRTTLGRTGPPEDPWRIVSQVQIRELPG